MMHVSYRLNTIGNIKHMYFTYNMHYGIFILERERIYLCLQEQITERYRFGDEKGLQ